MTDHVKSFAPIPPEDFRRLTKVQNWLWQEEGGAAQFEKTMVRLVRQGIDEVIDTARSGRFTFNELDPTEKAYIGVRVEILFRSHFSLERGSLDVRIAGEDIDIKNTTKTQWMIPTHSVGKMCLLVRSNLLADPGYCSMGLCIARPEYLNSGANQDKKKTISAANRDKIVWLFQESSYPSNVLESISETDRKLMLELSSGQKRVARLFELIQRMPVPRHIVEGVARQTDAAKRVRKNGGARDLTEPEGLYILSHDQQRSFIEALGLPQTLLGDYISLVPKDQFERDIIDEYLATRLQ